MKRYQAIARLLAAQANCRKDGGGSSFADERLERIMRDAPSGSGIDYGTKLDDSSTPDKLVFTFSFHHMNELGYYDGWTEHKLIVTPCLQFGSSLRITGRDRNQIKDYLYDDYSHWLDAEEDMYQSAETS